MGEAKPVGFQIFSIKFVRYRLIAS
jgi:hypothetical protein